MRNTAKTTVSRKAIEVATKPAPKAQAKPAPKAAKPAPKAQAKAKPAPVVGRSQAYRLHKGSLVGTEGNLSTTGFLPAPSEAQLKVTKLDEMSNARLMHLWNANVAAATKAGIVSVVGFENGNIVVKEKRSLWLSTAHGIANVKALAKALGNKFVIPTKAPTPPKIDAETLRKAEAARKALAKLNG